MMETIKLTLEIPAELATALTGFLESLKDVAKKEKVSDVVDVVDGGAVVCEPPKSADEVIEFCKEHNLVVNGRRFYNTYNDRHWHNTKGKRITNWKELILMWDEEDRKKYPQKKPASDYESMDDTDRLIRMLGVEV